MLVESEDELGLSTPKKYSVVYPASAQGFWTSVDQMGELEPVSAGVDWSSPSSVTTRSPVARL